jgi:internalin A
LVFAAVNYLSQNGRQLLLVFDQFEEVLGLESSTHAGKLLQLVADVTAGRCGPCRVLIALRIEFIDDLTRAGLPLFSDENHYTVRAFDETAARRFLAGGFTEVGEPLLDRVVTEAAALDNLVGRIRPITLNMVGQMLRRLPQGEGRVKVGNRPFADYLRRVLGENDIRDHAPHILRQLLGDRNQRLQRSVKELAGDGSDVHVVNGCLVRLGIEERGLVRCLNPYEPSVPERKWEISHDFVAEVLGTVLPGLRPSLGRYVRPTLAGAAVLLWIGTFVVAWPYEVRRRHDAIVARLGNEFGMTVVDKGGGALTVQCSPTQNISTLKDVVPLLRRLGKVTSISAPGHRHLSNVDGIGELSDVTVLDLQECTVLENVDGLAGLASLQTLNLHGCNALKSVDGLTGLVSLQTLDLGRCTSLKTISSLKTLSGLRGSLNLMGCESLSDVDGLTGLNHVTEIDMSFCGSLANLNGLSGLTQLEKLSLSGCSLITNVDALTELNDLRTLKLRQCQALKNINGLANLTSLKALDLGFCTSLENIDSLKGLIELEVLYLTYCPRITTTDPLANLTKLQSLDLAFNRELSSIEGLRRLTALQTLRFTECVSLVNVNALADHTNITALDLNGCESLTDITGLRGLVNMQRLDMQKCRRLKSINVLKNTKKLEDLNLAGCEALEDAEVLKDLPSLKSVDLIGCKSLNLKSLQTISRLGGKVSVYYGK